MQHDTIIIKQINNINVIQQQKNITIKSYTTKYHQFGPGALKSFNLRRASGTLFFMKTIEEETFSAQNTNSL